MNAKFNSYEKTELIYKQIVADEENEKAKKITRLRDLRLSQTSSDNSHEQKVQSNYRNIFCTAVHKRTLKTFLWTNNVIDPLSRYTLDQICPIML